MDNARFIKETTPGTAEVWQLDDPEGAIVTVGWRKGSRWLAVADENGEAKLAYLTREQMRQLGEIAREI